MIAHLAHGEIRQVRRRTAYIAVGQSMVKGAQLVIALALVRLLDTGDWNRIAFLLSLHLAGTTIGTLNLQHSLLFFIGTVERPRALVLRTAAMMGAVGTAIAVVLIATAPTIGSTTGSTRWVPWVAVAILLELPAAFVPSMLLALERPASAATWDILTSLLLLGCVVLPAASGAGAAGVVWGLVVAAAVKLVAAGCVLLAATDGPWLGLPPGTAVAMARYGLPLAITLGVGVLNRSVDKWLIAAFRPHDVGLYSIAAQEIPLLAVLPYAGGAAVATRLVHAFREGRPGEARHWWQQQTASMSRLVVPLSAALILVAPELFTLLLDSRSAAGVLPFQLFAAITLHRVAEYGLVLRAADRTRHLMTSAAILLTANLVMAGIGAALWGMAGAAGGTLVANLIAWIAVLRHVADALGTGLRGAFPWQVWATAVTQAAIGIAAAFAAASLVEHTALALATKLTVFAAAIVACRHLTLPERVRAAGAGTPTGALQ